MIVFFTLATATAIGHHLFYQSLTGTLAPDAAYAVFGANFSKQQLNIAVGTAFAFFFKAFLVLALSIAFTQSFWWAARGHTKGKPVKLGHLDSAYSAADSVLVILSPLMYSRIPMLMGSNGNRHDDAQRFLADRNACGSRLSCLTGVYQARVTALRAGIVQALATVAPK